jgi:hypothetical protein
VVGSEGDLKPMLPPGILPCLMAIYFQTMGWPWGNHNGGVVVPEKVPKNSVVLPKGVAAGQIGCPLGSGPRQS